MDEIETKGSDQTEPAGWQVQVDALRHFVLSVLILVVVISGTVNIYLLYQFKATGRELEAVRPLVANLRNGYAHGDGPAIERFVRDSMEYGKTHPDFGPYLDKYGLRPPPGAAPVAPANAPAPVPAPAPAQPAPKK
jgi:hypothetical protein